MAATFYCEKNRMSDFKFPVSLSLRLDWSEQDSFGHINNVAYFKYIQASRVNYWERLGLNALNDTMETGPLLASAKCDFKKPLHYPGNIVVRASITGLRRTSFSMYHQLIDAAGNMAAEGFDIIVMYNYAKAEKVIITPDIRSLIESLEEREFPSV